MTCRSGIGGPRPFFRTAVGFGGAADALILVFVDVIFWKALNVSLILVFFDIIFWKALSVSLQKVVLYACAR